VRPFRHETKRRSPRRRSLLRIDDAASIRVEHAEKELTDSGFDVVEGHADAELFLAELETGTLGARWGVDRGKKRT